MGYLKFFADFLTAIRALVALSLIWLGINQADYAIEGAAFLMLIAWISDYFDGLLARKSGLEKNSWLGIHDLEIDMLVALGLLAYLTLEGFTGLWAASGYVLIWGFFFLAMGVNKSSGSLFQAPIYAYFLWLVFTLAPRAFNFVLFWVFGNLLFTWRRFVFGIIPDFFGGLKHLNQSKINKQQ
jgi:phosphatidylglycerophosphate synthase